MRNWHIAGKTSLFVLALLALATAPALAQADHQAQVNDREPFETETFNPCNGEFVFVTGTLHFMANVLMDSSGKSHIHFQQKYENATGTGETTGATYRVKDNELILGAISFEGSGLCPSEFTVNSDLHLTGAGAVPDFTSHFVQHLTINANCQVSIFFSRFSSDCK